MIAALTIFRVRPEVIDTALAPAPKPRSGPLLMGDIVMMRQGEPEFLIRWREDAERANDNDRE